MTEPLRPTARPADERMRQYAIAVVLRLVSLIRTGRSYSVENKVFHEQLDGFLETLAPVFAEAPEALLVSLDDDLYLNGVRLPVKKSNLQFSRALMREFALRRIAGLRVTVGVDADELERFFRIFLQPKVHSGPAMLGACLAERTHRILPAVHASTEADDVVDPFDPGSFEHWDAHDPTAGVGAPEGGGPETGGSAPGGPAAGRTGNARPAVPKSYSLALLGARSLLTTTTLQDGMPLRQAKRVVQPIIDAAFSGETMVMGLSSLSHHHEYTYAHAVNVCIVAVTMGYFLGLDRRALADIGVAALLHDVGKAAVYGRIHHPLEEFNGDERRLAESHPLEGAKLVARSVALEHHACADGQGAEEGGDRAAGAGYPALPPGWRVSRLSEIVSVADCYVSLQSHRSERGRAVTPYEALGMVLGPYASRFDPALLWALVRSQGVYPPGQLVELSDGQVAAVLTPAKADPYRPHVRVILDEFGVPFAAVEAREYRPLPPELSVKRALAAAEYPDVPLAA